MSNPAPADPATPLRIVYLGTGSVFSLPPLHALFCANADLRAVVIAAQTPTGSIAPLLPPRHVAPNRSIISLAAATPAPQTIVQAAWERAVPVFALPHFDAAAGERFAAWQPDLLCVACFPLRLPGWLLDLPRHGALNIHPSLLPARRGPAPLFWAFRAGERTSGVTVHFMHEAWDAGPIAAQAPLDLPHGTSGPAADQAHAERGGQLLVEVIERIRNGTLETRPQPADSSSRPWPGDEDFAIPATWPAQRAFDFMRGTAEWNQPYTILAGDTSVTALRALGVQPDAQQDAAIMRHGSTAHVRFAPGVLHIALDPS